MSKQRDIGDDVNDILRQFPGPVVIFSSKARVVGRCAVIAVLAAAMAWICWSAARRGNVPEAFLSGVFALLFAFIGALNILAVITNLDYLCLDPEGFEIRFAWIKRRHSWRDVDRFSVRSGRARRVVFNDDTLSRGVLRRLTDFLPGRNAMLPDAYGYEEEDFASLMNEWRARALGLTPFVRL
jgi:hypothetical protein